MDSDIAKPTVSSYLSWIAGPFFRWWWAALTGVVSILGYFGTPPSGFILSRNAILLLIFAFFSIAFLGLSSTVRGWKLFFWREQPLRVISVRKDKDYDSKLLFVLDGFLDKKAGVLLEIRRLLDRAELPFCVVRVIDTTEEGRTQAVAIWTSPSHMRAFSRREFGARDLRVSSILTFDRIQEVFDEQR